MELETSRFGKIEFDETMIIDMKGPILGFENLNKYVLLKQNERTPFSWFQSVEKGSLAFVVMNPQILMEDYEPEIGDNDVELLKIETAADVSLLSIVTIRSNPTKISANLRAPIVINSRKRLAKQIVLEDADYPVQYEVATQKSENEVGKNNRNAAPECRP